MAYPSIAFNDGVATTITSGAPRLNAYVPDVDEIGPRATGLGDGMQHLWRHRTDYWARFILSEIAAEHVDDFIRLKRHLIDGGSVTLTTADRGNRVYTCRLRPETTPTWELDRELMVYALTVELKNTIAAPMLCVYQL